MSRYDIRNPKKYAYKLNVLKHNKNQIKKKNLIKFTLQTIPSFLDLRINNDNNFKLLIFPPSAAFLIKMKNAANKNDTH